MASGGARDPWIAASVRTDGEQDRGYHADAHPRSPTGTRPATRRCGYFAANLPEEEIPEVIDSPSTGLPAGRDKDNPPQLAKTEPYKTHLAYVKERRTEAEAGAAARRGARRSCASAADCREEQPARGLPRQRASEVYLVPASELARMSEVLRHLARPPDRRRTRCVAARDAGHRDVDARSRRRGRARARPPCRPASTSQIRAGGVEHGQASATAAPAGASASRAPRHRRRRRPRSRTGRVVGEQRGDVAVGADAEEGDVEPTARVIRRRIAQPSRRRTRRRPARCRRSSPGAGNALHLGRRRRA